jgi:hypothetical protein
MGRGSGIQDRDPVFPDLGVKMAPDPGSGCEKLVNNVGTVQ